MWWILLCICCVYPVAASVSCDDCYVNETALKLQDILPPEYDKLKPPGYHKGAPIMVQVKISVINIHSISEEKQEIGVDIFFHQYWYDHRIIFPKSYNGTRLVLDNRWRNDIWTPDIYFKNSITGGVHSIIIPYTYLVLYNDSQLFLAARIGMTLNCGMNLAYFPHDIQECDIKIMSLFYPVELMHLEWKEFHITKNIFLSQFYVSDYKGEICNITYDIGTFSCLTGQIMLARRLGYYLINCFVPSVLVVFMSFVTFWVPATAYPARVSLGVTSLLTVVTQQYNNIKFSVSYVLALNIWMLSCMAFVFFSLLEYALVITSLHTQSAKKDDIAAVESANQQEPNQRPWNLPIIRGLPVISNINHVTIDKICRFLFPCLFTINCVIYWAIYARLFFLIDQMYLEWKDFHMTKNIFLSQFYVSDHNRKTCNLTYDIGTFSCLIGEIMLARRLGYYLINCFVPSVLVVFMSFVTFWVPATAYPARVSLGVTSLLTVVTQQYNNIKFSVSYVLALNVWMMTCIAFVFFSLLEYALVIISLHSQTATQTANKENVMADSANQQESHQRPWNFPVFRNLPVISNVNHVTIDKICRILFPSLFIINCVVYWSVYARR